MRLIFLLASLLIGLVLLISLAQVLAFLALGGLAGAVLGLGFLILVSASLVLSIRLVRWFGFATSESIPDFNIERTPSMPTDPLNAATLAFRDTFGREPTHQGRAPGRVELLGNHTDYNGGLVCASAIDRETVATIRATEKREGRVLAVNLGELDTFSLDQVERNESGHWSNYVRGVVWALQEWLGSATSGFEMAIAGNVPNGAGLSSSASLQASVALALVGAGIVGQIGEVPTANDWCFELAHRLQRSENEFVGVGSGLLDQFSVLFGREGQVLSLDCATLAFDRVPLGNPAPAIVVCDSRTSRRLADGMYNQRREECERIVSYFQRLRGNEAVGSLRDVSLNDLQEHWSRLDPIGRRRARHVLSENVRVADGTEALREGQIEAFARLLLDSHASSRDDFENSSEALDALIASAEEAPGFLGGKLSGAGWAGCTVNLVVEDQTEAFAEAVRRGYSERQGIEPSVYVCRASEGGRCLSLRG